MTEFDEDIDEPDDADVDADEMPCPYCGKHVYEQAEVCPHCGNYISQEDAPSRRWPRWMWVGFLLALVGAVTWIGLHY